jgi:hypothetical protein
MFGQLLDAEKRSSAAPVRHRHRSSGHVTGSALSQGSPALRGFAKPAHLGTEFLRLLLALAEFGYIPRAAPRDSSPFPALTVGRVLTSQQQRSLTRVFVV